MTASKSTRTAPPCTRLYRVEARAYTDLEAWIEAASQQDAENAAANMDRDKFSEVCDWYEVTGVDLEEGEDT